MRLEFFKIFLLWFVFISLVLIIAFLGIGSEGGLSTILFATSILALPLSIAATFIHKWVLEARVKSINRSLQENIFAGNNTISLNELSSKTSKKFVNFIGICTFFILGTFIFFPLPFIFFFYYLTKKFVDLFGRKLSFLQNFWYISAFVNSILLYFILYFGYQFLYGIAGTFYGTNPMLLQKVSGLNDLLIINIYIAFFVPVLFYEWYRTQMEDSLSQNFETLKININPRISVLWFILVPNVVGLMIVGISSVGQTGSNSGWAILGLIISIPLGLLFPSIWIFWRDRTQKNLAKML